MQSVNVTEFRNHLPAYLDMVQSGEELALTLRGKTVARLVPEVDASLQAQEWLARIRKTSWVGDVTTPLDDAWEVLSDTP